MATSNRASFLFYFRVVLAKKYFFLKKKLHFRILLFKIT